MQSGGHKKMLKWMLHKMLRGFESRYAYDAAYCHEILDVAGAGAFLRFWMVQGMGAWARDLPDEALHAARLAAIIEEDCGPCAQLSVRMAEEARISDTILSAVVRRDDEALPPDVRLAVQFVRSALARDDSADELREQVVKRFGQRALVTLAYTLTTARLYPSLKYALGHGQLCMRLQVGQRSLANAAHAS